MFENKKLRIQVLIFCVVTSCGDVVGHRRFGGRCCLHLQGDVQKTFGLKMFYECDELRMLHKKEGLACLSYC